MLRRIRRRWKTTLALGALASVAALNVVAYRQAWRMTHYVSTGPRTASPEALGITEKLWAVFAGVNVPRPQNRSDPGSIGLDFETRRFSALDGVGLEAWFVAAPPGSAAGPRVREAPGLVLLFHGYASAKESLLTEAREFHDLGLDVLMVDFRGSGGSDGDCTSVGWYEALDVQAAIAYARRDLGPERVVLHGSSLGAAAVLRAVHEHGVLADALILEGPFSRMLDTTVRRFQRMGLPAFPAAWLLVFWGGRQLGFDAFSHDPQSYVASVTCPTLLLFGGQDPNVSPADARAILTRAGRGVEHRFVPGAGHPPLVHGQRELWRAAVADFLERCRIL